MDNAKKWGCALKHPSWFIEEFLCDWKSCECIAADVANLQVSHQCQWWQEIQQWWSKQGVQVHFQPLLVYSTFLWVFIRWFHLPHLLQSTVAVLSRQIGNYNVLLQSCPVELYDVDRINWAARRQKSCVKKRAKRRFGLRWGPITRQIPQRFCSLPLGVTRGKATQNCQNQCGIVDDCRWLYRIYLYVPHHFQLIFTLPRSSLLHQGSPSRGVTGATLLEAMKAPWASCGWAGIVQLNMEWDIENDMSPPKNTQNKAQK